MRSLGEWSLLDEIRCIESGFFKGGDPFLRKRLATLKRRFNGFGGGEMRTNDEQLLIRFCCVVGGAAPASSFMCTATRAGHAGAARMCGDCPLQLVQQLVRSFSHRIETDRPDANYFFSWRNAVPIEYGMF